MDLSINGQSTAVDDAQVDPRMPLLWVLRDVLHLTGTKFGCGVAACGACTVHVDGAGRALVRDAAVVAARQVDPHDRGARQRRQARIRCSRPGSTHQVPQCGYCQSGMLMAAAALLEKNREPSDADIDAAITNLCRCGTYPRMRAAIKTAARRCAAAPRRRRDAAAAQRAIDGAAHEAPRACCCQRPAARRRAASSAGACCRRAAASATPTRWPPAQGEVGLNGWIKIAADGAVLLAMNRSEMGQGVHTALAMLVAEELDVPLARVRLHRRPAHDALYGNVASFVGRCRSIRATPSRARRRTACKTGAMDRRARSRASSAST